MQNNKFCGDSDLQPRSVTGQSTQVLQVIGFSVSALFFLLKKGEKRMLLKLGPRKYESSFPVPEESNEELNPSIPDTDHVRTQPMPRQ